MDVTVDLPVISLIVNIGGMGFIAWLHQKSRADGAELKASILSEIKETLTDYVAKQQYKDYIEVHGKEHLRIEAELTRLRDWKHEVDPLLRSIQMKLMDTGKGV